MGWGPLDNSLVDRKYKRGRDMTSPATAQAFLGGWAKGGENS